MYKNYMQYVSTFLSIWLIAKNLPYIINSIKYRYGEASNEW